MFCYTHIEPKLPALLLYTNVFFVHPSSVFPKEYYNETHSPTSTQYSIHLQRTSSSSTSSSSPPLLFPQTLQKPQINANSLERKRLVHQDPPPNPTVLVTTTATAVAVPPFTPFPTPSAAAGAPPAPVRTFLSHPVENNSPSSNLGKMCASVLMTILSSGRRDGGEKRR